MSLTFRLATAITLVFSQFLLSNTFAATLPNNVEKNNAALYVLGWIKELEIISLSTNQHTHGQSMVAPAQLLGVAVLNNTIYTLDFSSPRSNFWAYDILLKKWRDFGALPDFPTYNVWGLVATKDKIIGIGAYRVYEYDPRVEGAKWVEVGGAPQPDSSQCAVNINDRIYFFGGNMFRSDDAGRNWTNLASLNQKLITPACAVLDKDTIVVTGGEEGSSRLDSVHAYNIPNDVWLVLPSMLRPRSSHSSVALPGGNLLVCGGVGDNNPNQDCEEYDPKAYKWVVSKYVLDQPRENFGMVVAPIA